MCVFASWASAENVCVPMFRLHRMARSTAFAMSTDLLLACSLANATCAIANVMTALIFIIVSRLHAFSLVVVVCSFLLFPTQTAHLTTSSFFTGNSMPCPIFNYHVHCYQRRVHLTLINVKKLSHAGWFHRASKRKACSFSWCMVVSSNSRGAVAALPLPAAQ